MSSGPIELTDLSGVTRFKGTSTPAPGGGGGGGGIQLATVLLEPPAILDLVNTPVEVLPGVADEVIIVTAAFFEYLAGGTPYTDGGGNLRLFGTVSGLSWADFPTAGFWDQATDQGYIVAASPRTGDQVTLADAVADPVTLVATVANPTLGDGDLRVTFAYILAPVR